LNSAAPAAPREFDPACLLSILLHVNSWLVDRLKAYAQNAVLHTNFKKAEDWWANQPSSAVDTVQKVGIMMGIPLNRFNKNFNDMILIKI